MKAERFAGLWRSLAPIGRGAEGYHRYAWATAELDCRAWFAEEAADRGLRVETDRNGNLWAWLGDPAAGGAVVTGSHFDSVPGGGGYDGPLGIVSAFLALDLLAERGHRPDRPIGIVAFAEEEGGRFGVACLGSRLMTGALDPVRAGDLRDADGVTVLGALAAAGLDPTRLGPDPGRVAGIAAFVELHIEQGRALTEPVGVASAIWPHGRWRLDFTGEGNHAGTTRMTERRDPMLTFAATVLAANAAARQGGGHATVGRVSARPGATNAIASSVAGWLDARAADQSTLDELVAAITTGARRRAAEDGTEFEVTAESVSALTSFDEALRDRLAAALGGVPVLPTGAGHDAGVLAGQVPTAMLFVRNPTGVSHAPQEYATDEDCAAGVTALADTLAELACP